MIIVFVVDFLDFEDPETLFKYKLKINTLNNNIILDTNLFTYTGIAIVIIVR